MTAVTGFDLIQGVPNHRSNLAQVSCHSVLWLQSCHNYTMCKGEVLQTSSAHTNSCVVIIIK